MHFADVIKRKSIQTHETEPLLLYGPIKGISRGPEAF